MTAVQTNGKYIIHFHCARVDHNNASGIGYTTLFTSTNGGAYTEHPDSDTANGYGFGVINSGEYYDHMGWAVGYTACY